MSAMKQAIKSIWGENLVLPLANMSLEYGNSVPSFTSPPFQKSFGCCKIRLYQPRSCICHKGFSDDVCLRNIIRVTRTAYYFGFTVGLEGNSKLELAIAFRDRCWLYIIRSNILIDRSILSTPGIVSVYDIICHMMYINHANLLVTRLRIMQCNCLHNLKPQCN